MSPQRLYPDRPIMGVGILIQKGDEYLLIKRAAEPDAGFWSIPGGLVELGEKIEDAAIREACEETGLKIKIVDKLDVVDKIMYDELMRVKYHFIIIEFLANSISGTMSHNDDAIDAKWVNKKDLKNYRLSSTLVKFLKKIDLYPNQQETIIKSRILPEMT